MLPSQNGLKPQMAFGRDVIRDETTNTGESPYIAPLEVEVGTLIALAVCLSFRITAGVGV